MRKETTPKPGKKNTSLRLHSDTLKALKIRAIETDSSVQAIVEQLITRYLKDDIQLSQHHD